MASFDKYSNYNEKTSFSSVVFGAEKPVLETELNEMQQIISTKLNRVIRTLGYGIYANSTDSITFNASTMTLTVKDVFIIDRNGFIAYLDSASVVMSAENSIAYFKMQESEATSSTSLKNYGNTNGASLTNPIKDTRVGVETSRRKVITYTLISGSSFPTSTSTERYISVGSYNAETSEFVFEAFGPKDINIKNSITMGRRPNTVVGARSTALGYNSTVTNTNSFASGYGNTVNGAQSASFGSLNTCTGDSSFVAGYNNLAKNYQFVIGHSVEDSLITDADKSGTVGTSFVIGNGYASSKSNAFRIQYDGSVYAKSAYNATGADYAEYAEWADGNPNNEDRRGYFVTFDEEKPNMIRKAKADDVSILGVVSGNPCIIGNADECWLGKNLFDEFNSPIYEDVEEIIEGETIISKQYKVNPDYDPTQKYTPRSERPEWSAIGWIGVLPVRDNGACTIGSYCTWGDDGFAVPAEPSRFNYRVLERVNEDIIKIALK